MPFSNAQLSGYYQSLTGTAPTGADAVLINAYATQSANGTLSDTNALLGVFNSAGVQATFEVAESTYQFFTGSGVSQAGLNFLEGNAGSGNANGLNTAYYAQFNTENRYYNFAINLAATGGAGNASFTSTYGNLTFAQTVATAYETIVGSSNVGTAAANAAIADITSRQAFFTSVAQQRAGGVDTGGAAGQNIALKAVVIGYILEEANKADVGTYAKAIDQLEAAVAAQGAGAGVNNPFSSNIVTTFGASGSGFNSGFAALGANNNAQTNFTLTTGIDAPNLNNGSVQYIGTVNVNGNASSVVNPSTLQAGDQIRATGANNTLTVTTIGGTGGAAGTPVDATGGAVISGVQTINVRAVGDPNTGTAGAAVFNASGNSAAAAGNGQGNVTGTTALNAYLSPAAVTFNNVSTQSVGIINDGITTGGSLTANYVTSATTSTVNLAGGTTGGETVTETGAGLVTVNVNSNGGLNTLGTGTAGAAGAVAGLVLPGTVTTLNLSANSNLTLNGGITATGLTKITGGGTSSINAGTIGAAITSIDTTGLTGSFTAAFTAAPAATTTYNLGSGSDNLTFGTAAAMVNLAAGTNVNLGQGTNAFIVNGNLAGTATTTSSVTGGTLGDNIVVTGTIGAGVTLSSGGGGDLVQVGVVTPGAAINGGGNAIFLTGQADFAAITNTTAAATFSAAQRGLITGFTTVGITDALQTNTYDVNAIGAQNFTTDGVAAGQTATLNANTGAVVTFGNNIGTGGAGGNLSTNTGTLNIALANSATNANDVLNLGFVSQPAGTETSNIVVQSTTTGGVTTGVETINVTASGTTTNATNIQLNLVDAALTNISFAGNESITYAPIAAHTALKSINGAADTGTLVVDATALTSTLNSPVTITTGSGNDIVFVRDFDRVTTGASSGAAGFNTVTVGTTTNGQSYSSVLDAKAGDHINFGTGIAGGGVTSTSVNTTKIVLNTTAVFQDYLDAATGTANNTAGAVSLFDFGGNTYVVENAVNGGAITFQNGQDSVIQLVGIHTAATTSAGGVLILGS